MFKSNSEEYRGERITLSKMDIETCIKKNSNFRDSEIVFINWMKGGYTSKTALVLIDNKKYIFKKMGHYFFDSIDSIEEKMKVANELHKIDLFTQPINLDDHHFLFPFIEGEIKASRDWTTDDYKKLEKISKRFTAAIDVESLKRNRLSNYFSWIYENMTDNGFIPMHMVKEANEYFNNGNDEIFVHGDLQPENIVFTEKGMVPIDWDTFMVAKPMTDMFFTIIQTPWLYRRYKQKIDWIDWESDEIKKTFAYHVIFYYLRWLIVFKGNIEGFLEKFNIRELWEEIWT